MSERHYHPVTSLEPGEFIATAFQHAQAKTAMAFNATLQIEDEVTALRGVEETTREFVLSSFTFDFIDGVQINAQDTKTGEWVLVTHEANNVSIMVVTS